MFRITIRYFTYEQEGLFFWICFQRQNTLRRVELTCNWHPAEKKEKRKMRQNRQTDRQTTYARTTNIIEKYLKGK